MKVVKLRGEIKINTGKTVSKLDTSQCIGKCGIKVFQDRFEVCKAAKAVCALSLQVN